MRAETFRMSDETKQMFDKHSVTYDDAFVYVDVNGNTALHLAAYCGQIDTVNRMLLLNSKPPIVLNADGETAITLGENHESKTQRVGED
jgi:ankyrin repeat protein